MQLPVTYSFFECLTRINVFKYQNSASRPFTASLVEICFVFFILYSFSNFHLNQNVLLSVILLLQMDHFQHNLFLHQIFHVLRLNYYTFSTYLCTIIFILFSSQSNSPLGFSSHFMNLHCVTLIIFSCNPLSVQNMIQILYFQVLFDNTMNYIKNS